MVYSGENERLNGTHSCIDSYLISSHRAVRLPRLLPCRPPLGFPSYPCRPVRKQATVSGNSAWYGVPYNHATVPYIAPRVRCSHARRFVLKAVEPQDPVFNPIRWQTSYSSRADKKLNVFSSTSPLPPRESASSPFHPQPPARCRSPTRPGLHHAVYLGCLMRCKLSSTSPRPPRDTVSIV